MSLVGGRENGLVVGLQPVQQVRAPAFIQFSEDLIQKAEDEQLVLIESNLPVYETAQKLNALGL